MKTIITENAPSPAGHYTQGVVHGGLVWVSGQLPIDPATGAQVHGSIEEQTTAVLRNVEAVVRAAGVDRNRILRATVYVTDIALWPRVNAVYAAFFGEHRPARTVVPVPALHHGFLIEIDAVAALEPTTAD